MPAIVDSIPTREVLFDPASFRDPAGRVFTCTDRVFRTLSPVGLRNFTALTESGLLTRLTEEGRVVPSSLCSSAELGLDPGLVGAQVVEHGRIPFITYPYEWSFGMLRDGALLTLDLLDIGLRHDFVLKDATPFNVQFADGRPIWIDILSFEPYRANQPWVDYTQFCMTQLYPLMLTAYRGIEFQPWLRGSLGGLKATDMVKLLRGSDLLRAGVFTHAYLPARFERSFARQPVTLAAQFEKVKFPKEALLGLSRRLRKLITGLTYRAQDSFWSDYQKVGATATRTSRRSDVSSSGPFGTPRRPRSGTWAAIPANIPKLPPATRPGSFPSTSTRLRSTLSTARRRTGCCPATSSR